MCLNLRRDTYVSTPIYPAARPREDTSTPYIPHCDVPLARVSLVVMCASPSHTRAPSGWLPSVPVSFFSCGFGWYRNLLQKRPFLVGYTTNLQASEGAPRAVGERSAPAIRRQASIGLGWCYRNQPHAPAHHSRSVVGLIVASYILHQAAFICQLPGCLREGPWVW